MKNSNSLNNPYPGLRPFQFNESDLFFGRERQSEELLRKLRRNRFLAVVGTSGSGKSSLVRAGLLPLLEGGFPTDAGTRWRIALFRPGKNPINNMALALNSPEAFKSPYTEGDGNHPAEADGQDRPQLRAAVIDTSLRRSALGLADHARRAEGGDYDNLLVCVDQFEELFRFKEQSQRSNPEDEAAAFVKLLLEAARDKTVAVYVLLTMRSDFLGECSQFRDLPEAINEGQYLIPRMTRDEQRRAITEPAASRQVGITPRLVQRLLNDVGDNPDHLPLLQHALMRTWNHWGSEKDGGAIDLDHYKAVGGMEKALSNHAQQTYDTLPDNPNLKITEKRFKEITEKLFKALTEKVINDREIRRPAGLAEICAIADAKLEEVVAVIEHFRSLECSFLMPPPGTKLTPETVIDISHESLIKGWDLLKQWVEEEAKSKAIYQRIADAARRRYKEAGGASLWRDPDLRFAREWRVRAKPNEVWARRYDPQFKEAMTFLKESKDAHKQERRHEEYDRQRELKNAQAFAEQQKKIAEVERYSAQEAQRREVAERARADEAQRREEAEHQRAEKEKRLADAERERAEEQRRAASSLRKAAARLRFAIIALIIMLTLTTGFALYAYTQKNRADITAAQLKVAAETLEIALSNSEMLSKGREQERIVAIKERESAELERTKAKEAEAEAEEQKIIALDRARQLQITLDKLKSAEAEREQARQREKLERDGLIALEKGNVSAAKTSLSSLLNDHLEKDSSRSGQIAWSWAKYNLGTAYGQEKDYDRAVGQYSEALKKQKSIFGERSAEIVPTLNKLAQVYHKQNSYKESDEVYVELSDVLNNLSDRAGNSERIINARKGRAKLFQDEARDATIAAKQKDDEYFNSRRLTPNRSEFPSDPASLTAEEKLALEKAERQSAQLQADSERMEQLSSERYAAAEAIYTEIVTEMENLLPATHLDLVEAYNDLAAFYQDRALTSDEIDTDEDSESTGKNAEDLYKLAQAIRNSKLNPEMADEAEARKLEKLTSDFYEQKRYGVVDRLLNRALDIRRGLAANELNGAATGVRSSVSLMRTLQVTIGLLDQLKRDAEVRPYYEELLKVMGAIAAKPDAEVKWEEDEFKWGGGIEIFLKRAQYAEAQRLLELSIKIQRKALPNNTNKRLRKEAAYYLSSSLWLFGALEHRQKNLETAEQSFKESLEIIRREFEPDTELDFSTSLRLAMLYSEQGRYDDALPLFKRVRAIFESRVGPQQRKSVPINMEEKSIIPRSDRMYVRITESFTSYLPPRDYQRTLLGLAEAYSTRNENQDAEQTYNELLEASKWIIQNYKILTPGFLRNNENKLLELSKTYEHMYADALASYSVFLKKPEVSRAAEAKQMEQQAAEIRSRLGPKKEEDLF